MRHPNRKLQITKLVLATSLVLGAAMIAGCPKNGPTDPDGPACAVPIATSLAMALPRSRSPRPR